MAEDKFALIKWTKGDDAGSYTVGININHIKNFDLKKFNDDIYEVDKTFAIEWHDTKKEPLGGWLVYEGIENNDIDTQPTRPVNLATKLDAIANENKTIPLESIKDLAMKSLNNKRKSEAVETQEKISNDQYVTKKDLHDVLNSFFSGLNQKTLKRQKTSSDTDIDSDDEYKSNPGTSKTISNNNKEVKMIGSGENKYPIPRAKWDIAKLQPTFTRMSWHLVMASFDENILLKSNYQGGRSKKKKIEEDNKLEKLDRNKMNAIKETVKLHFKEKFNDSIFGTNVNTRLSQLRHDAHKPQQLEKKNQKKMTDTDESL
ncbi:hypothetical protein HCN44_007219 [Aphidius gifuensis]|uniref:BEN domain-containing protein n=1 Tax=Aphidius gifuensis TaxID=684658 RepID=A0A835CMX5_APHGI|nr:hypothetical protein HCN44_007219 [Aphidius gifuensis]